MVPWLLRDQRSQSRLVHSWGQYWIYPLNLRPSFYFLYASLLQYIQAGFLLFLTLWISNVNLLSISFCEVPAVLGSFFYPLCSQLLHSSLPLYFFFIFCGHYLVIWISVSLPVRTHTYTNMHVHTVVNSKKKKKKRWCILSYTVHKNQAAKQAFCPGPSKHLPLCSFF